MSDRFSGYVYLALAMIVVGSTVVASKVIGSGLPVFTATALRFAIAFPCFLFLMRVTGAPLPRLGKRDWLLLVLQAGAGSVGYTTLLIAGMHLTSAAGAAVIAARLLGMADTPSRGAVFLVELALAQRAARDSRWEEAAIESGRVLAPAVRRLSTAATDVAATDAVAELAAVWLETGKIDRADEAIAAASIAAATLPPTHPVAVRIGRLAARAAVNDGDEAKALDLLATSQASGRRGVRPVAGDRQRAFLARVTDAAGVDAVLRYQQEPATVSGPPSR